MKSVYTTKKEVTVKNVNGSSKRSPKCSNCGPWLDHWKKISGGKSGNCSIVNCSDKATDGAHTVRPYAKDDDYQTHAFILPMCHDHNMSTDELTVKIGSTFVWANSQETCGQNEEK